MFDFPESKIGHVRFPKSTIGQRLVSAFKKALRDLEPPKQVSALKNLVARRMKILKTSASNNRWRLQEISIELLTFNSLTS